MGISDLLRKRAAMELGTPEERVERSRPGLERYGLGGLLDPGTHGTVHLDTGHQLTSTMHVNSPELHLHIRHPSNPSLNHRITVDLGAGDEGMGDRIVRALGHPRVMQSMREQMKPGLPDPWPPPYPPTDGSWPRRYSFS